MDFVHLFERDVPCDVRIRHSSAFSDEALIMLPSPHFRMTRLLPAAINQLARYTNSEATALLVKVAIRPRITDNRQVLAIGLIARRNDPEAFTALSNLLQPHINLGRREAVANALKDGICTALCIQSILHSRTLVFGVRDERNLIPDEPLDEPVKSIIERDNFAICGRFE